MHSVHKYILCILHAVCSVCNMLSVVVSSQKSPTIALVHQMFRQLTEDLVNQRFLGGDFHFQSLSDTTQPDNNNLSFFTNAIKTYIGSAKN